MMSRCETYPPVVACMTSWSKVICHLPLFDAALDLTPKGVTLVEPVYLRREPQPSMDAVYYLSPTEHSVEHLIRDFDVNDQQYGGVHLLFTRRLPDDLFAKIKQSKVKGKIRSFREINIDYLAYEQRTFHLDMHQALWNLYSPHSNSKDAQLRRLADKLMTVFATLDQEPIIRFAGNHHIPSQLATLLKERVDTLKRGTAGWPSQKKPRPILLLLERSYDMVSPFIHELTYQAMCQDLLPIVDDVYAFESEGAGKREVLLNENDILWPTLRHKHIADTSAHLIQSFRAFIASNAAVKFKSTDVNTLQDMSKVLRAMPEFQELREKYALHISLANRCIQEFGAQQLEQICYLEQALATGTDKEYKAVKSSEIARDLTNAVKHSGWRLFFFFFSPSFLVLIPQSFNRSLPSEQTPLADSVHCDSNWSQA
jgi:syntaxin-binding protein 1